MDFRRAEQSHFQVILGAGANFLANLHNFVGLINWCIVYIGTLTPLCIKMFTQLNSSTYTEITLLYMAILVVKKVFIW